MSLARPLFWRKSEGHPQDGDEGRWVADGLSGRYHADKQRDGTWLLWWAHDNFVWEACATFAEVKEKAEVDWQKRFRDRLSGDIAGETSPFPLSPPSSIADDRMRSEGERYAVIAECAFDDRPRSRVGHPSHMDWEDGFREGTQAAASAIRAALASVPAKERNDG